MSGAAEILQLKIHLKGISPMIWRRVLVPSGITLRELHGVIQVVMGWEGYHLYEFDIHAVEYGSIELNCENPDVPLNQFGLQKGSRFSYVYDMGDYWQHDIRVEGLSAGKPRTRYPKCTGGARRCPKEDSGGIEGHRFRLEEANGYDAWSDVDRISSFTQELIDKTDRGELPEADDIYDLEGALERMKARERYLDDSFLVKQVNDLFKEDRHEKLKFQNIEEVFELDDF